MSDFAEICAEIDKANVARARLDLSIPRLNELEDRCRAAMVDLDVGEQLEVSRLFGEVRRALTGQPYRGVAATGKRGPLFLLKGGISANQ
jgi:hypothetical protein